MFELRNKKYLIEKFISSLDISSSVDKDWLEFVEKKKKEELDQIILEEKLKEEETYKFVEKSFKNWEVQWLWTELIKILPKVRIFWWWENRWEKKARVLDKLMIFFNRFFDITDKKL